MLRGKVNSVGITWNGACSPGLRWHMDLGLATCGKRCRTNHITVFWCWPDTSGYLPTLEKPGESNQNLTTLPWQLTRKLVCQHYHSFTFPLREKIWFFGSRIVILSFPCDCSPRHPACENVCGAKLELYTAMYFLWLLYGAPWLARSRSLIIAELGCNLCAHWCRR